MMVRSRKKNRKTLKEIRQKKRRNERRKNERQHQMVPVNVTAVQRGGPVQELQDSSRDKLLKQWWTKVEEDFEEWVKQMKSQLKWLLIETNNDDEGSEGRISEKKLRPDSASRALNCLDYGQFVEALKNLQRKLSQLDDESEDDSGVVDAESAKNERNFELHSVDARIADSHSSSSKRSSTYGNELDDVSISSVAYEGDHESVLMDPSDSAKNDEIDVFARWEGSGAAEINHQTNDPEPPEANVPQEGLSLLFSRTEPLHVSASDNHLASRKRLLEASEEEDDEDHLVARSAKNRKKNPEEPELLNEVDGSDSFLEKYYTSAEIDEGDGSEDDEVDNGHPPDSSEDGPSQQSRVNEIGGEHLDEHGPSDEIVFYTDDVKDEHTDELDSKDNAGLYLERHRSSDEKHDRRTEDDDSRNDPSDVNDEDLPANKETSVEEELYEFDSKIVSDDTTTHEASSGPKERKFDEDVDGDESGNNVQSLTEMCISPTSPGQTKTETYANLVRFVEKIKGFLNGLTESDMQDLAIQMERLCSKRSQRDFYANLLKLLTDSLMSDVPSPERNVMQQTTSVTIHHANICSGEGADNATVAGIRECTVRLPRLNLSQVSSLLSSSTVPNVGTPDHNYRVQISFTVRDPATTRVQASSAQFSGGPTQQQVLLDSSLPISATVAESVPSSVPDVPRHYTDFKEVPIVESHKPPYLYTVNWPNMGNRFWKQVFRSGKDRVRCRRCGWLGKTWKSFYHHYYQYSRCAKAEDKTNVSIYKEAYFVDTTSPKPGEVQYFRYFRDLPLVRDLEPPYDYILCSSYYNLRFMNDIFRNRIDFLICCKCKQSYQDCHSFNDHWSSRHKKCNKMRGFTKRIHVH